MDIEPWKPINYRGAWAYNPKDELRHRAQVAQGNNDSYVAIPVALALVCSDFRECKATTQLSGDEDGPFKEPITIVCRQMEEHTGNHFNGAISWKKEERCHD